MAAPIRTGLIGAAVAVLAVLPSAAGVRANESGDRSAFAVVSAGSMQMRITAFDGVPVAPTRTLEVRNPPVPSEFTLRHVIRVHNAGSAAVLRLALAVDAGRGDSRELADRIIVAVETSDDQDAGPHPGPCMTLAALEGTAAAPVSLPRPLVRGQDVDVTVALSAAGLDNSLQGAQVNPRFTLIGGG